MFRVLEGKLLLHTLYLADSFICCFLPVCHNIISFSKVPEAFES